MTRFRWISLPLTLLTLTLAGCPAPATAPASGSKGSVAIGFLSPLTGADAAIGEGALNGARLAIDAINAAGGVNGKPLTLVPRDDQGDPAKGVDGAKDLQKQGVVAIVGPSWSGVSRAVVDQVTKAAGIPVVSPGATSPALATFDDGGLFFRTIPNDSLQGRAMSQAIQADGHTKIAVLCRDNVYGNGFADALVADFNGKAGNQATKIAYPDDDKQDYPSIRARIPAGITAATLISYTSDAASIFRDWVASAENADWKWYFSEGLRDPGLSNNIANNARLEGLKGTFPLAGGTYLSAFNSAYQARYAKAPGIYDAYAYDAAMLIALAMVRGQANTAAAVKDNLVAVSRSGAKQAGFGEAGFRDAVAKLQAAHDVNYDGVSGTVDMDDRGEMTGGTYVIWQWVAGKPVDTSTVYRF